MTLVATERNAWCLIHNRHEPILPGTYLVCGECWHVWPTAWDLYLDVLRINQDMEIAFDLQMPPIDLDRQWACPLCTHDF
jgi:hypothetical protein